MKFCLMLMAVLLLNLPVAPAADNTLTEQEKKDGWLLLFDGQSTKGWMSIKEEPLPGRHVQDALLQPLPRCPHQR